MNIEALLGKFLRVGVLVAAGFMAMGLLLLLLQGNRAVMPETGTTSRSLAAVMAGLGQQDPAALIELGLILLTLTPITRVAAAAVAFAWERDYPLATASLLVLLILGIGLALGKAE